VSAHPRFNLLPEPEVKETVMVQKNARLFFRVFDSLTDPLAIYDQHYRITLVNQVLINLHQLPTRDLIGKHCYEVFHQRTAVCENCHVREVFRTGAPHRREMIIDLPDGRQRHFVIHCFPVRNDAGQITLAIEHGHDVTEPRSLEHQLRVSEERYRTLVEHAREGIFMADDGHGRLTFVNKCMGEMLGYAPEEILGRSMFEFMDEDAATKARAQLDQHQLGEAGVYELKLKRRNGADLVGLVSASPLKVNDALLGSVGIITDVTDKRQTEAALASHSGELQRTQHHLETLFEISRQVSSKNSLVELIDSLQDIIQEILPESDSLFLILDASSDQFLSLRKCSAGVAEPVGRFLQRLEEAGAMGEFIQSLQETRDPQIVTMEERHKLPPFLDGILEIYPSWFGLPIFVQQECIGFFVLGSPTSREYVREDLHFVHALFAQIAGYIRHLVIQEVKINQSRQQETEKTSHGGIIGQSKKMQEIYELIDLICKSDATVLITGENGTGKELVAKAIHQQSHRRRGPFVVANCSAYSPTLLESELFGHERGAFTGAIRQRKGRIERSHGGTLFLDEIGDISPATQVLLLRFLQDHCFERVGGERPIEADVRVLAATNRDLHRLVEAGRFRDDLYYRLNVISIHLPLLRERKEDIPLLALHFLKKYNQKEGKHVITFASDAMEALMDYEWPGNVRQLENAVSHALILAQGDVIRRRHLPRFLREAASTSVSTSLAENERHLILRVLQETNWNKHDAARRLKVSRSTLYSKIRRYGLEKIWKGSVSIQT
jgi:PAS domain S-box-containing protein